MPTAPLASLRKDELVYRATHRCIHRHTYIEHPQCLPVDRQRIGFLDIETFSLDADYGMILTWAIKTAGSDEIVTGAISARDIKRYKGGREDKRVVAELVAAMQKYDLLVTYYGSRFDVPYIRTRALVCGVEFPEFGVLQHHDLYYLAKYRLKLSRNSLDNVCRTVIGATEKTRVSGPVWREAARGNKKALAEILDHNRRDVRDTERVYDALFRFTRTRGRAV